MAARLVAVLLAAAAAGNTPLSGSAASSQPVNSPTTSPHSSSFPPPVATLHAQLDSLQYPPDCGSPSRRFLAFQYSEEQGINGFGAMFQFYAAALVLAHRYNRTLVEVLPRGAVSGRAGGPPVNSWDAHTALALGLAARTPVADPWQRAPPEACGGSKMACFFAVQSTCALTPGAGLSSEEAGAGLASSGAIPLLDVAAEEAVLQGVLSSAVLPRVARIDTLARYGDAIRAVTAGDGAPGWWEHAASAWACGRGSDSSSDGSAPAANVYCGGGASASSPPQKGSPVPPFPRFGSALPASQLPWRRLWFPAFQAWAFRPRPEVLALLPEASGLRGGEGVSNATVAGGVAADGAAGTAVAAAVKSKATAPGKATGGRKLLVVGGGGGGGLLAPIGGLLSSNAGASSTAPSSPLRLGLHFRAGDAAVLSWRASVPLPSYFDMLAASVATMPRGTADKARHSAAALFLATDSATARAALPSLVCGRGAAGGLCASSSSSLTTPRLPVSSAWLASAFMFTMPPPQEGPPSSASSARDAHIHIESWMAAAAGELGQVAAAVVAAGGAGAAEAEATLAESPSGVSTRYVIAQVYADAADAAARGGAGRALPLQLTPTPGSALPPHLARDVAAAAAKVHSVTAGVVADVWALSRSHVLAGTCLSQVSRTGYELAYASGQVAAPPVGPDAQACADFPYPHAYTILADWHAPPAGLLG